MKKRRGIKHSDRDRWVKNWQTDWNKGKYNPFIRTEDVPSFGTKHRCRGIKSNRVHHFLSANEYSLFVNLEFNPSVISIYEQFPMLPLSMTKEIANELKINHPRYTRTTTDMILTTDFFIELNNGEWEAYSVKPTKALNHDRTIQKQAIEKAYWELQGIKWHIVLDSQLKTTAFMNLSLLRHYAATSVTNSVSIPSWIKVFQSEILEKKNRSTSEAVEETSRKLKIDYKLSSSILFHCLWHRIIAVNLNIPIHLEKTPIDLGIVVNA